MSLSCRGIIQRRLVNILSITVHLHCCLVYPRYSKDSSFQFFVVTILNKKDWQNCWQTCAQNFGKSHNWLNMRSPFNTSWGILTTPSEQGREQRRDQQKERTAPNLGFKPLPFLHGDEQRTEARTRNARLQTSDIESPASRYGEN